MESTFNPRELTGFQLSCDNTYFIIADKGLQGFQLPKRNKKQKKYMEAPFLDREILHSQGEIYLYLGVKPAARFKISGFF